MTSVYDTIFIKKLCVPAIIGLHPWERKIKQKLSIDVTLFISKYILLSNTPEAPLVVDYAQVMKFVQTHIEKNHYYLLEALANTLAHALLTEFNIVKLILSVSKVHTLEAPVGICIERCADDYA